MRHPAAMYMGMAVACSDDPVGALVAFREAAYAALGARRDALFEILDALLTGGAVPSPVQLSLVPVHRRGWGSFYAALAHGEVSDAAVERLLEAAERLVKAGTAGYDTETRRGLVVANITGYLATVSSLIYAANYGLHDWALLWPLVVLGIMLALGPVDLSILTGGARGLLPALGGLDMSGIRLVGISAALGLLILSRREILKMAGSPWARWYVLFLAYGTATLVASPDPLEGIRLLLKLTYPLLLFLVVAAPGRTTADVQRLGDWALWGATILLLVNPFVVANGGYAMESGEWLRVWGPGSHHNPFSFYLLAVLLLCVARYRGRGQTRYLLLGGLSVLWIVGTLTRITLLASFVAMAVVALYTAVVDKNKRTLVATLVLGGLMGGLLMEGVLVRTFGYLPGPAELLSLAADPVALYEAINWQGRELLWAILWIAFRQSPWLGGGLGASTNALESAPWLSGGVAHNEYLRLAVDVGVFGSGLFLLAMVAWLRAAVRAARVRSPATDEFALPAIAALAAWALIAITDNAFDYYAPFTQYVAFLVAGAVVTARERLTEEEAGDSEEEPSDAPHGGPDGEEPVLVSRGPAFPGR
ncbi:MAG: O-antigen ligase family protein [Gemmatimonadetes bacterium]|nr:O-antigen ligase family protein [Gemmatimonadota bacterium]